MRQTLKPEDEQHLAIRALNINYAPNSCEGSHVHDWPQLLYSKKGAIRALVNNRIWVVPPRRALWIPAGQQHKLTTLGAVQLRTLYCNPIATQNFSHTKVLNVSPLLHEAILRCCSLQYLDRRKPSEKILAELIVNELDFSDSSSLNLVFPKDSRAIKLAEKFIEADKKATPLEAMLSDVGLSKRTAERLFLNETGISPGRWRRLASLAQAMEHLLKGISIADTANLAGYASRSAFTEAFTQVLGISPSNLLKISIEEKHFTAAKNSH